MEINTDDLNQKIESVSREIESMSLIERQSRQELDNSYHHLNTIEGVDISLVEFAKWLIMKERQIYLTLNKMKKGDSIFRGLFWTPLSRYSIIKETVSKFQSSISIP
jgi:hypothetical protein